MLLTIFANLVRAGSKRYHFAVTMRGVYENK